MRGSLLVTFDELIDDRGVDSFSISVNNVQRDFHFTDVDNYYSTYCFSGDSISITIGTNDATVIPNMSITRLDYTTDAEGTDNGIKETQIYPVYSGTNFRIFSFTAETVNSAYNFHYKINISTIQKVVYSYSLGYDPSTPFSACQDYFTSPTTYYTWEPTLENGVYIFTTSQFQPQPADGYYSDGTNVWYKGTGLPLVNESVCATPTPTPTMTPTMTPTPTPTPLPPNEDVILALASSVSTGTNYLIKSSDGGNSFSLIRSYGSSEISQFCCSSDGQTIYSTSGSTVQISTNGGSSFTDTNFILPINYNSLICNSNGSMIACASGDGVGPIYNLRVSIDYGNTYQDYNYLPAGSPEHVPWREISCTTSGFPILLTGSKESIKLLRTQPVYTLTGYTSTIQPFTFFSNRFLSANISDNLNNIALSTTNPALNSYTPLYISNNGGVVYNTPINLLKSRLKMSVDGKYIIATSDDDFFGSSDKKTYVSSDSGITFNEITALDGIAVYLNNERNNSLGISSYGKNMYVRPQFNLGETGLWVSNDYGVTWTNKTYVSISPSITYSIFYNIYVPK